MQKKHGFLLTAWVFLPDHWTRHYSSTVSSDHFDSAEVGEGELDDWHQRPAERSRRAMARTLFRLDAAYCAGVSREGRNIHLNAVPQGFVQKPEDWKWSSMREYARLSGEGLDKVLPTAYRSRSAFLRCACAHSNPKSRGPQEHALPCLACCLFPRAADQGQGSR